MKKLNKFFAVLVALAMMAMLSVTAFAAGEVVEGTETNPAKGYLTKELQMPVGTDTPASTFTFSWTQLKDKTNEGIEATPADTTKLAKNGISFESKQNASKTDGDVKKVIGTYEFSDAAAFTKAGRYQFDVEEVKNNNTSIDADLTYSPDKYLVTMDIAQAKDGTLYVKYIAVQKYENNVPGTKVTPGKTEQDTIDLGGDFKFVNKYVKKTSVTPDGKEEPTTVDSTGLFIQKTVIKNDSDTALAESDKATEFTFTVKVKKPSLSTKESYVADVVKTANAAADVSIKQAKYTFTFDENGEATQTVTLKHGQRLVFEDLDIGATYEVEETPDTGFSTKYDLVVNGGEATETEGYKVSNGSIAEGKDSVTYKNKKANPEKPTGILISNLPYIALALVAIGGLVAYVVVRRKADDEA